MDLKDMILVMENYKGTERNMLMTLEDYKKFVAIDEMCIRDSKFCYEVNGYTISVSRINTTIHMYLTVRSGTSPLGDVPGGLSQIRKRG